MKGRFQIGNEKRPRYGRHDTLEALMPTACAAYTHDPGPVLLPFDRATRQYVGAPIFGRALLAAHDIAAALPMRQIPTFTDSEGERHMGVPA